MQELRTRGLSVEEQKEIKVSYKGVEVGSYYADILVNELIILELKSVDTITGLHEAQLLNHLK